MEKSAEFAPEKLKAPFFLRCTAFCIDYMLLLTVPILWLLLSQVLSDSGVSGSLSGTVWLLTVLLWVLDFILLPLVTGRTVGKMLTGLTIVNVDGTPVRLSGLLLRNLLGYALSAATLGIGFLVAAVNTTGRGLHDLIAGTIVVSGRKRRV